MNVLKYGIIFFLIFTRSFCMQTYHSATELLVALKTDETLLDSLYALKTIKNHFIQELSAHPAEGFSALCSCIDALSLGRRPVFLLRIFNNKILQLLKGSTNAAAQQLIVDYEDAQRSFMVQYKNNFDAFFHALLQRYMHTVEKLLINFAQRSNRREFMRLCYAQNGFLFRVLSDAYYDTACTVFNLLESYQSHRSLLPSLVNIISHKTGETILMHAVLTGQVSFVTEILNRCSLEEDFLSILNARQSNGEPLFLEVITDDTQDWFIKLVIKRCATADLFFTLCSPLDRPGILVERALSVGAYKSVVLLLDQAKRVALDQERFLLLFLGINDLDDLSLEHKTAITHAIKEKLLAIFHAPENNNGIELMELITYYKNAYYNQQDSLYGVCFEIDQEENSQESNNCYSTSDEDSSGEQSDDQYGDHAYDSSWEGRLCADFLKKISYLE